MANVQNNLPEHQAALIAIVDGIDFTMPGSDQSLGRDMATAAAVAIVDRSVADQHDATGADFRPLNPAYAAAKRRKFGVDQPGIRTGQMLSLESVKGQIEVTPDTITMTYGTGKPATRASTYGSLRADEPTDQEKAVWFTEGGRPFYDIEGEPYEAVRQVAEDAVRKYLGG